MPRLYQIILNWCEFNADYCTPAPNLSRPTWLLRVSIQWRRKSTLRSYILSSRLLPTSCHPCRMTKRTCQGPRLIPTSAQATQPWNLWKREKQGQQTRGKAIISLNGTELDDKRSKVPSLWQARRSKPCCSKYYTRKHKYLWGRIERSAQKT